MTEHAFLYHCTNVKTRRKVPEIECTFLLNDATYSQDCVLWFLKFVRPWKNF